MIRSKCLTLGIMAATLLALTGCGNAKHGKLVAVEGKVIFKDGKPLPKGTRLYFHPATGKMGFASAVVAEDGTFQVTHETGKTGAAIGKYTVQLAAPEQDPSFFKMIPRDYYDGGALMADVKESMSPLKFVVARR
jgi:hypothetical protein